MVLSVQEIYSVRFGTKLPLPKKFQDIIAQLRISPAAYRPVRSTQRNPRFIKPKNVVEEPQNWRESKLIDFVSKFKNTDDPDYGEIMSKFNKITPKTLEKLSNDIIEIIQKRDEDFRLRINVLLFDRAITQDAYSTLMSDLAKKIYEKIPETVEDLKDRVALFRFTFSHCMPSHRGDGAIGDWLELMIYRVHGFVNTRYNSEKLACFETLTSLSLSRYRREYDTIITVSE